MKDCKIHSGGLTGPVKFTVCGDRIRLGNTRYGKALYTINGNRVMEGDSRYGRVAFTIRGNKVMEGDNSFGKVLYTINGDRIIVGNSSFGSKGYTIEYEKSSNVSSTKYSTAGYFDRHESSETKREQDALRSERLKLERERSALERERARLKYENWYNTLSPEEKLKEDKRVEEMKRKGEEEWKHFLEVSNDFQEKEKKCKQERKKLEKEKAEKAGKKNFIILISAISAVVLLVVGTQIVPKIIELNSDTNRLISYLEKKTPGYKNGTVVQYIDIEGRGKVYFYLEYVKNGWAYSRYVYDFRVSVVMPPKSDSNYTQIQSSMCFNLSGSDNEVSFVNPSNVNPIYNVKVTFGNDYAVLNYRNVQYDSVKKDLVLGGAYFEDTSTKENLDEYRLEWTNDGWGCLASGYDWANDLYHSATGKTLYK